MYKSLRLKNFMILDELTLDPLGRVNLIAGKNNMGKSSILESLFILGGAYKPELGLTVLANRGMSKFTLSFREDETIPWAYLFSSLNIHKEIEVIGTYTDNKKRTVKLIDISDSNELLEIPSVKRVEAVSTSTSSYSSVSMKALKLTSVMTDEDEQKFYLIFDKDGIRPEPRPPNYPRTTIILPSRFQVPKEKMADRYSIFVKNKKESQINEYLRYIEPRLKNTRLVTDQGKGNIFAEVEGIEEMVPIEMLGGGINRLLEILMAIGDASNGFLLIDEIENGFHYSVLDKLWKMVGEMSKETGTQVFATTHSYECVRAAHEVYSEEDEGFFFLHRLDMIDGKINSKTYKKGTLEAALEMDLEVR